MKNNYGSEIHNLMFNDYIIIGPRNLAEVSNSLSSSEVFAKIYNSGSSLFRSDSSGTQAEMSIWTKSGLDPTSFSGSWYLESEKEWGP